MVDLHLEVDEGILLQATEVERYGRDEYSLDEMVLTNKYIICVYEKSNGLFSKSESITEKIPLSKIKVAGGKVQVMRVDNDDYGVGMQVLFADGTREHFIFSNNKKELPIWIGAISQAITGEQYIEPETDRKKGKKSGAGMAMFAAGLKEVSDTLKQTAGETKQQVVGSLQEAGFNVRNSETQTAREDEVMEQQPEVNLITPKFCVNCGEKLKDGAKFCFGCGSPVSVIKQEISEQEHKVEEPKKDTTTVEKLDDSEDTSAMTRVEEEELTERKVVYEGKIHKCPNCGEVLGSFQATCPACGYEVRDAKNSYSVREFAAKLEEIEHSRSSKGFGIKKMLQDQNEVNETDQKKINLIRSYVIPNTKEDLLEFLILASSNINLKRYNDFEQITMSQKAVSDAWEAKFEQAYEKAKLSFGNTPEFQKIQSIYEKKNGEITKSKKNRIYLWVGVIGGFILVYVLLMGLLISLGNSDSRKVDAENQRLEAIVDEVYEALENDNFVLARAKAASLTFSGPDTSEADKASEKWDKTRAELLELIDAQSKGQSITPGDSENESKGQKPSGDTTIEDDSDKNDTDDGSHVINSNKAVEVTIQTNDYLDANEFAWYISGGYLHCVISINNISSQYAIEYPAFRVTAYDADNKVMGTEEQVLSVIYPGQEFVCNQLLFEVNGEPSKITVTLLEPEDYGITAPSNLDHKVHEPMTGKNISVNGETVTGEIYNPNDYRVDSAWVTVVFRNKAGEIVYGENTFVDQIPAKGTVPFEIDVYTDVDISGECEVYAYFW